MGNCQTAHGKSCSSSNEDGASSDLKSKESIVGDNEVKSPIEAEKDVSSSGSVALSTNNGPQTLDLDNLPALGDFTSNTEVAEVEVGSVSSSTSSSSSGGVEEERREVAVDNGSVSVASNDSSASSVVIVEDVSRQSEDDEIRDLHASDRNLHPSEGQLFMEPTSESSLEESSGGSTPSSTTKINNSSDIGESGGVDIRPTTAKKSRDITKANMEEDKLHTSPSDNTKEVKSSKPHPQCSPRKSLQFLKQDSNQNGDLDAVVKSYRKEDKKDESTKPSPQQHQHSEEVQNFLLFTGTTDHRIAKQYLEMSGLNNVGMAVGLYVDHQQQSQRARQKTVQPPPLPRPKVEKKSWVQVGNKWVPADKCSKLPTDNKGTVPQVLTLLKPETSYIPNDVTNVKFHQSFIHVGQGTLLKHLSFSDCQFLKSVELNEGLQVIGRQSFQRCKSLQSITFPSTLIDIGEKSFSGCVRLQEVVLNEGLKKIVREAFNSCHSLQTITLPSTLIELGVGAFYNCTRLNKVVLNEGPKIIGPQVFSKCTSLSSINLPSTIVEIGVKAFFGCSHLKMILLNDGLKRIWSDAFGECTSLKCINLPFTITKIDPSAFSGNNSLIEVLINENIQDLGANSFNVKILPCAELQPLASSCRNLQRFKFASLSARLETIIQRGYWSEIEDKIDANLLDGVIERSGDGELFISRAVIRQGNANTWASVYQSLNQIARLISYYEMKEATSLVELALWKSKINQASDATNREACRVDMPGPAKDMILQYL